MVQFSLFPLFFYLDSKFCRFGLPLAAPVVLTKFNYSLILFFICSNTVVILILKELLAAVIFSPVQTRSCIEQLDCNK